MAEWYAHVLGRRRAALERRRAAWVGVTAAGGLVSLPLSAAGLRLQLPRVRGNSESCFVRLQGGPAAQGVWRRMWRRGVVLLPGVPVGSTPLGGAQAGMRQGEGWGGVGRRDRAKEASC